MTIPIYGYRDVWLILTDSLLYIRYPYWGILPSPWWDYVRAAVYRWMIVLVVYLTTSTSDIILGHILLSFARFVWEMVWGWMISVGCLSHDFDIGSYTGAYFPIFFTYPWDWNSDQLSFRLCTSLKLLTIDCIRTSLHGFVEIEMDHIRFHLRSIGGSFIQMLIR